VIIEAIIENKQQRLICSIILAFINDLHTILPQILLLFPLLEIAGATAVAERVAGMHFFNPAPLMKLVEIVYQFING